jgi:hypothetical protein
MDYLNEVNKITDKALAFIKAIVSKRGDNPYELIDPTELEEREGGFYELPTYISEGEKHGSTTYDPYSIVAIELVDDELVFKGVSKYGDNLVDEMDFPQSDINSMLICELADKVAELEGEK